MGNIVEREPTDVRVDRSPVDHVMVPDDRVDALYEAAKTCPCHVQASACIPSCAAEFLDPSFDHA